MAAGAAIEVGLVETVSTVHEVVLFKATEVASGVCAKLALSTEVLMA
jgi:hypothetical protein